MFLKEDSPIEMLRQFAVNFNADLIEDFDAAKVTFDNNKGKGSIHLFEIMPGLAAWVYNIKLSDDLKVDLDFTKNDPYYFGFNVEGYQLTKYEEEEEFSKIHQNQNFILIADSKTKANWITPKEIAYKSCYLIINPKELEDSKIKSKRRLQTDLKETFECTEEKKPYRYFGSIDTKTATYAEIIIENERTDLVGRLLCEGAIINMLGSQIKAHDEDLDTDNFQPSLTKSELSSITELGDFILKNVGKKILIRDMALEIGLNEKKVQKGIRFLYGMSANEYQTNIRLENAKKLLYNTDQTISEICYQIGISNRSYFAKIFKERFGLLPSDYRKSLDNEFHLYEVSYRSIADKNLTPEEVDEMINNARKMNEKHDITGCIIYHKNIFFQIIEGSKKDVLQLYENINKDQRHTDIETMWDGFKVVRDFGEWSMATISNKGVLKISHQGFLKNVELDYLIDNVKEEELSSKEIWRKVRNIIKVSVKHSA